MAPVARDAGMDPDRFAELLDGARRGDGSAWEGLYRWLAPPVTGYFRVQGAADAEDLTSEVFLGLIRAIERFRGDAAQFRSFVFVIAHRRLQDARRSHMRRAAVSTVEDLPVDDLLPASSSDDVGRLLAHDRVVALCDALAPDQRDVVLLRIVADLSLEQVANTLGKSVGAVKSLQHRAFEQLKRAIDSEIRSHDEGAVSP